MTTMATEQLTLQERARIAAENAEGYRSRQERAEAEVRAGERERILRHFLPRALGLDANEPIEIVRVGTSDEVYAVVDGLEFQYWLGTDHEYGTRRHALELGRQCKHCGKRVWVSVAAGFLSIREEDRTLPTDEVLVALHGLLDESRTFAHSSEFDSCVQERAARRPAPTTEQQLVEALKQLISENTYRE